MKNPIQAQAPTLTADAGQKGTDESVFEWRNDLRENPGWAIARAIARSLMVPYPQGAFTHGLSVDNYIELYLPCTALRILCLPAIFVGMVVALARERVMTTVLLLYSAVLAVA